MQLCVSAAGSGWSVGALPQRSATGGVTTQSPLGLHRVVGETDRQARDGEQSGGVVGAGGGNNRGSSQQSAELTPPVPLRPDSSAARLSAR